MFRNIEPAEQIQYLKEIDVYGYVHIPSYLNTEVVTSLKKMVENHYVKDTQYKGVPQRDKSDKILYNLQNKDKIFIDILGGPALKNILMQKLNDRYYRFLPDDVPNYILNYYNARSSGQKLDYHIDSHIPVTGNRTWLMQAAFVLEDQDETNGCAVVVPGSHLMAHYTDRELIKNTPLVAHAGDLLIWDSRLWHGTGENKTGRSRWVLIATFSMWWIKQAMDITRSLPGKIYAELSTEQKALLGFCSIPPADEKTRINTKTGYESLMPSVLDYYKT